MTERERNLIAGVLVKVMTGTLDSSKSLDDMCEDFIDTGDKIINLMREEQIKEHEQKINDCYAQMYNQRITNCIPQCINPISQIHYGLG